MMDKAEVARCLREISLYLQLKGENAFKSRAYDIASDRLLGLTEDLGALVASGRLEELPGIGEALARKISELWTTGRLAYLDGLRAEFPAGILEVVKIQDLGPRKAAALWRELQVGDVASLEQACKAGRVRALKGFGEKTERKILDGIALFKTGQERKRLGDALPMAQALLERVLATPGVIRASIAGSVRRHRETVADVDLIASARLEDTPSVLEAFATHPAVATVLGRGESKCSVRLQREALQVDLRVLPDEDFATALHHFTGSKAHHLRLRSRAQDLGLKISEWGVHRGEEKLPVREEADLYALLGLQYVPPELREDAGELEAAERRALPGDLVQVDDVRGVVHSHSTWSDGRNTLEEMATAAAAAGMTYLTVTEHSQTSSYARGLTPDDLKRQWEQIDRINERLAGRLRLLRGLEVDILEDGALDMPDALLDQLEVVIGSIHQRHGLDEDQMTDRVLRAFDHPRMQILGHPTGRLIGSRAPYPLKIDAILDKAAQTGVAIEVNGNPERLDIKDEYVRKAVSRGVKLVVSSDSHSVDELCNYRFAVGTARRGWATRELVLNAHPLDVFVGRLRPPT